MPSVLDYRRPKGWKIEDEVRLLLKALKRKNTSTAACRRYAEELVQSVLKRWNPGDYLTHREAQRVGAEFDRRLLQVRDAGWKVPRLEQPPFRHRDEMTEQDMKLYLRRIKSK